jgi:hypothetical protein
MKSIRSETIFMFFVCMIRLRKRAERNGEEEKTGKAMGGTKKMAIVFSNQAILHTYMICPKMPGHSTSQTGWGDKKVEIEHQS